MSIQRVVKDIWIVFRTAIGLAIVIFGLSLFWYAWLTFNKSQGAVGINAIEIGILVVSLGYLIMIGGPRRGWLHMFQPCPDAWMKRWYDTQPSYTSLSSTSPLRILADEALYEISKSDEPEDAPLLHHKYRNARMIMRQKANGIGSGTL